MDKYDYVITKPEMEDLFIEHGLLQKAHKYIDKYMKNGKWIYKYKSKAQELDAKVRRKIEGRKDDDVTTTIRKYLWDGRGHRKINLLLQKDKDGSHKHMYTNYSSGARVNQGTIAGRKRAKKQYFSAKVGAKTKGYSRKGNIKDRGYSSSQGSGESKRQRNLGTRYSKNKRLSAEYLRERAYNSKKNRL